MAIGYLIQHYISYSSIMERRKMNDKQIVAFKNRMRNYGFLRDSIEENKEELELKWYDLSNLKGVSFDRQKGTTNEFEKNIKKLDGYDDIQKLEDAIAKAQEELNKLDDMMEQMPVFEREMCKRKFINNFSYQELSVKCYMDRTTLKRKLDKALHVVEYIQ